jgi:hypothetical protein
MSLSIEEGEVLDLVGGSGSRKSATLRIAKYSFDLRNYADVAQQAGGKGHHAVKVLHLEAVSILSNQRSVVAWRERRPSVECSVEYMEFDVIHTGSKEPGHVKAIRRMPKRTGGMAIDCYQSRLMNGRVEVGVNSRTSAGNERVRQAVGAEYLLDRTAFGRRIRRAGQRLTTTHFEVDMMGWSGSESDIAGVNGLA